MHRAELVKMADVGVRLSCERSLPSMPCTWLSTVAFRSIYICILSYTVHITLLFVAEQRSSCSLG